MFPKTSPGNWRDFSVIMCQLCVCVCVCKHAFAVNHSLVGEVTSACQATSTLGEHNVAKYFEKKQYILKCNTIRL